MAEAGVDISGQVSTAINELPRNEFDWVITLCGDADESCPYFPGKRAHQGFDDPPKLAAQLSGEEDKLNPYRQVRDQIREFVESLPYSLR